LLLSLSLLPAFLVLGPSAATGATVDGLKIHSSSAGDGSKTVILVHGWTCDDSSWTEQVPALAKTFRVVTLDLPGHGRSDSPRDGQFSMDLFARAVEAEKSQLGNQEYSKRIFPALEYTEIPGTGHFVMMEKPLEFNQLLTTFVNKISY
jgi:pimeloyl-ACP methyl ester carboxylesterase